MRYIKILPIILFFTLSYFLFWKITNIQDSKELKSVLINKDFPILPLEFLEGSLLINDIIGNKPFILNYFASWCAPCRIEHEVLKKYNNQAIIIGVAYKDSKENIRNFLKELGNPYDLVMLDKKGRAAIDLGVYGVPETYFIDDSGKIRYRQVGPLTVEKFENIMYLINN